MAASPSDFLQSFWWTAQGEELAAASTQPSACLAISAKDAERVSAGQALFNTPALLGGQAAKAGLNCASCHVNGRNNPHFFVKGLSGLPGTADVTTAFFSMARANAVQDPVKIPDLAQPGKISRARGDPALERFIRTLVVDEFSGKEPSAATLSALAAYVRAIVPCPEDQLQNRNVGDQITLIAAAVQGAQDIQNRNDRATLHLLVRAIRHQLGLIHERYNGSRLTQQRQALLDSSRALEPLEDQDDLAQITPALINWHRNFEQTLVPKLLPAERHSLYAARHLGTALKRRSTGGH